MVNGGVYYLDVGFLQHDLDECIGDHSTIILDEKQVEKFVYAANCGKSVYLVIKGGNGIKICYPAVAVDLGGVIYLTVYFWNENDNFSSGFQINIAQGEMDFDHDN